MNEPSFDDQLKHAIKAFKKRLKLTRLDYESKMGYGPTTTGRSPIVGIMPPSQFPQAVWMIASTRSRVMSNETPYSRRKQRGQVHLFSSCFVNKGPVPIICRAEQYWDRFICCQVVSSNKGLSPSLVRF